MTYVSRAFKVYDEKKHILKPYKIIGLKTVELFRQTHIPRDRGINAMLVTEVPTHPLTSQTERAWLGAKK